MLSLKFDAHPLDIPRFRSITITMTGPRPRETKKRYRIDEKKSTVETTRFGHGLSDISIRFLGSTIFCMN